MSAAAVLMLFDIDGTLLAGATAAHRDALHEAVHEVHGVDVTSRRPMFSPAGRTDGEIARLLLLAAGVSAQRIDERADAVREVCCRAYARLCPPDLSATVLGGIPALLEWCGAQPDVHLSLLTGNFEPIARLKLHRAGLGHHFPAGQGAFGSDSEDRAALPAIARRRAGSLGAPHPRERTLVIGDTPRDIACARADGVHCAALATGSFLLAELEAADLRAADATALREPLAAWLGAAGEGAGRSPDPAGH
ncbi:MAG: phosphoglycolate phosphatase [Solirubrobacteraceae bacterium]|nr:phosphoglycolate phosphatase [Solirubrobacteraceae bacterium]